MASAKRTPIDLLNDYLRKGMKPPPALAKLVAESEALKKPPLALDPPQMLAGGMAGGMAGILPRLLMNEAVQGGFDLSDFAVPKLTKNLQQLAAKAQKGVSGQTKPLGGAMGETGELMPNGVKLPGGGVAAEGTKFGMGGKFPGNPPVANAPTEKLEFDDAMDMSIGAADSLKGGSVQSQIDELMHVLGGGKHALSTPPEIPAEFLEQGKKTSPLPPQGAGTTYFGLPGDKMGPMSAHVPTPDMPKILQGLPEAPKTKKLTPWEAHENVTPSFGGWDTKELAGTAAPFGGITGNAPTRPLSGEGRTMSLEPEDIEEMAGKDRPSTGDLLEAFKKNLGPKDTLPLPENTLYHGLKVFGHTPTSKSLSGMAQEGMKGGWFSEEPHQPFGPNFIATTPEDLPPMLIREKQFSVDPEKELIPRWNKYPTESLEARMKLKGKDPATTLVPDTIKGRPAKRSLWPNIHQLVGADEEGGGVPYKGQGGATVPPEKLFMADRKGDIIGRLAPKGGKGGGLQEMLDKAGAFKNVLEKGTSGVENVFARMFGSDPDLANFTKEQKIAKLKQFLKSGPPESKWWQTTGGLKEIFAKHAKPVIEALEAAGEDIPK